MSAPDTLRFKVDENCPAEFGILQNASYRADHVLDEGLGGSSDSVLAAILRSEGRTLLTLDLDFADVRRFPPAECWSDRVAT